MTKKKQRIEQARLSPELIAYGYDENGTSRAGKFFHNEVELARKAAGFIGLQVYEGDCQKLGEVLKSIPAGKLYASGWDFAPKVRKATFDKLIAELGVAIPAVPDKAPKRSLPTSWQAIELGDVVIGQANSAEHGWWPAAVVAIDGDMLELRSPNYPKVKVVRHRTAVALLFNPKYRPPEQQDKAAPGLPLDWTSLAIEQLVLAPDQKTEAFYEAIIIQLLADELTLKWRDAPRMPPFRQQRTAVALINPFPPKSSH
jgi:hypothetical protein